MSTERDVPESEMLEVAKQAIRQEIKGLEAVIESLGAAFVEAVTLIQQTRGRLILCGMGKSGHIANKMAATFASTGTKAFFVHPGEASHGDLGMIDEGDVVLMLSNSGETAELQDVIHYCTRFQIPMIALVRRHGSILVDAATVALVLPEIPEATPTGAPTTSTTMMLALGDALAVALMHAKGFDKDDFGVFHPGGKLGKAFIRVRDLMHEGDALPLVPKSMPMSDVLIEMTSKGFGCAGVVGEDGTLAGIITDGDLRRHMSQSLVSQSAAAVMTAGPKTIRGEALATEAVGVMNGKAITTLFVVNEAHQPVGILHLHDCLRAGIV